VGYPQRCVDGKIHSTRDAFGGISSVLHGHSTAYPHGDTAARLDILTQRVKKA